jgi:hypothetical protein
MKKIYLVIVVFFLSIVQSFNAQTNWSLHSYDDFPEQLVNVNGFQFFVYNSNGNTVGTATDTTGIIGVRPNGNIKFRYKTNMYTLPFGNVKSVIKTNDNCVLLVGESYKYCDAIPNAKPCVLLKIDTNGVAQFTQTLTVTYTGNVQSEPFRSVIQKPDSSFLVFSTGYFHQYSKSGNFLTTQTHTLGSINASAIASNSIIIASHSVNSGTTTLNYLSFLDLTGAVISTNTVTNTYSKFSQNSLGDYYGLTSNHCIEKINTSLTTINTSSLSQGAFLINDFDILNDTIYACGKNASNHSAVLKFDKDLTSQYINTLSNPNYNFTSISCQTNSLNIVASDKSSSPTIANSSISYFKTNLYSNINLTQDAYAMGYILNSGSAYTTPGSFTFAPVTNHFQYSLQVKVFNAGSDTLKSVYLNSLPINYQGPINCYTIFYHQLFTGLSIAPNSFGNLIMDNMYDEITQPTNQTLVAGTTYTLSNICVWTSSPNFKSDANHTNDAYCGNVVLPVTTGLKELDTEIIAVTAYPNPTSNKLQFNHIKDGINYMVTCYDITGKEKQTQLITTQNNEMDLESLDNGIYILKISDGMHTVHQKIIKQD